VFSFRERIPSAFVWRCAAGCCFLPGALKTRLLLRTGLAPLLLSFALPLASLAQDEFYETLPDGTRPPTVTGSTDGESAFPGAARQCAGSLSGRIVFTCGGHGWAWNGDHWTTGRGVGNEMNEDYGNLDQMNFFIPYAFNAGAAVVAFRPIGCQTNEVVLDNDSRGVRFSGKWFNSRSTIFFGRAGAVPYRFALLAKTETATAAYTPRIPAAGFYPVYTWVRHGPDRTSQLYRILHTGGQTLVRVPHHMVGSGWVYLGTYFFEAGADRKRGSVIISNLQPSPGFGSVAVADAIRFGNGMGDVVPVPGAPVSTYPREEEASLYWVLKSLGQGQTNVLSARSGDQGTSNVSAPPRMARAMNRTSEGNMFKRIYLGFHSNAGGGRGPLGLWNDAKLFPGTETPHQQRLAELVGAEVSSTLSAMAVPPLELPWFKRSNVIYARNDYAFGEINNRTIRDEFDATILEVAFLDSRDDAKLLRDPKVRDIVARCSYRALVRYMNEFDGLPLQFLPEPPRNLRVTSAPEGVCVAWDEPVGAEASPIDGVQSYLVSRSENGYGFGNPVRAAGSQTSVTLPDVPRGKDVYFRVTAVNAAGESLPSAVAGCRPAPKAIAPRVLVVNAFTELNRFNNLRQTLRGTNYIMPSAVGKMDRVIPRLNNASDYVVQHGKALAANGAAFDSCQREAVANGTIQLEKYVTVIWAAGRQRTEIATSAEQRALSRYLAQGGSLFVSGSYVADLLRRPENAPRELSRQLHAAPADEAGISVRFLSCVPVKGSIFRHNQPGVIGDASEQSYFLNADCRLLPEGTGAQRCLLYPESSGVAAVRYDGSAGGGKVVCFGFPFECVSSAQVRARYMRDILRFFASHPRP
jgi:hypothetical protein